MKSLEEKIQRALYTNKLNPAKYTGKGKRWYNYYVEAYELVWARNFRDGYEIMVYENEEKREHLATVMVDYGFNYKELPNITVN
ncbi:MAG: hypothetical protein LBQ28_05525 [Prevotellaceae bacterium]|jgi:hypothetical protein|nr:hypothetical protein [Prevotellaceae bacterium]